MNLDNLNSIEQLEQFLEGSQAAAFEVIRDRDRDERYQWIQCKFVRFRYLTLGKRDRGVVIRFLGKVTGYSRQQLARLIKLYHDKGKFVRKQKMVNVFKMGCSIIGNPR